MGFPGACVLHDGWMRILHPEEKARVLSDNYRMKMLGEPFAIPMRVRVADGTFVACIDWGMPMLCATGCYQGCLRPVETADAMDAPMPPPTNITPPPAQLPFALITMAEAAAHVGLSVDTLYRMLKRGGTIWAHRANRKWLVDLSELLRALRH